MAQRWLVTCDDCPTWQHVASTPAAADRAGSKHAATAHTIDLTISERVTAHQGLAVYWTRHTATGPVSESWDDVYADALVGLWDAARHWQPTRGVTFAAYASHRIRGQIADGRRERDPLHRGHRARGVLSPLSLDALIGEVATLIDVIPDPHDHYGEVDERDEQDRQLAAVLDALPTLSVKQQHVIRGRLCGATLAALGAELGVTESRAHQLQSAAVDHLRRLVAA